MTGDELAEQVHRLSASDLLRGRVAAVAINPMDHYVLAARRSPPIYEPPEIGRPLGVNGWPIFKTRNVPEGQVRLIPFGDLEVFRDGRGQVYLWPAFTIRTRERAAQMGAHVTPGGRLEPRSEHLDPAFDHRHAERLARTMGDVITRREAS
jgi:hypothetical protein